MRVKITHLVCLKSNPLMTSFFIHINGIEIVSIYYKYYTLYSHEKIHTYNSMLKVCAKHYMPQFIIINT